MVKAAEHLRAKKAAAAAAAAKTAAASAGSAAPVADSTQDVQPDPSVKGVQAASDQTVRVSNQMTAPAAPTAPTNEKTDAEAQPAPILQPKTVPVSKPPMVRPAAAPKSKQAMVPSMASPVGSAPISACGQTKDGHCFEMAMRRDHPDLCSRLPANVSDITQQTLIDLYSGSEISRMCGNTHE